MKNLFVSLVLVFCMFATVANGHPSVVAWNAVRMLRHEQQNTFFGYTLQDSTKLLLAGNTLAVERTVYYPQGSQYVFTTLKENYNRQGNADWFICTNATEIAATYRMRGGGFIGRTNNLADYWNERSYPGGNGTVIWTSDGSRFTQVSQTTYRIDNTGDEQGFWVYLTFDIGGAYVTDKVACGPNQVVMYTPSLAALARKARRKVNNAGLAAVNYGPLGAGNFASPKFGIVARNGGR